jgi:hypothetical protein
MIPIPYHNAHVRHCSSLLPGPGSLHTVCMHAETMAQNPHHFPNRAAGLTDHMALRYSARMEAGKSSKKCMVPKGPMGWDGPKGG